MKLRRSIAIVGAGVCLTLGLATPAQAEDHPKRPDTPPACAFHVVPCPATAMKPMASLKGTRVGASTAGTRVGASTSGTRVGSDAR